MNKIFRLLTFSIIVFAIHSCDKEENQIFYEGGTAPALTASASDVTLESGQETNTALVLNWTNPEYNFTTGISSHDVTYTLEMDTSGAGFKSSKKYTTVIAKELSKSFTVAELNGILGNDMRLQLNPRRNYTFDVRVTAGIGSAAKLSSNIVSFTTKPFAPPPKVEPPASNELYITGNAVASDWTNTPPPSQKFTRESNTLYELTVPLYGGKSYTFLPVHGSWDYKYSIAIKNDPTMVNGGDFKAGGEDILAPAADGNYKITVDFQVGKFTVTKQ